MQTVDHRSARTKPTDAAPHAAQVTAAPNFRFPGLPRSVSAARSWVAGFFPDPATAADAALLTGELVTNAILHSASRLPGGQVTVRVLAGDGTVRVDVLDAGQLPPPLPQCHGLGQGLALVAAIADDFGSDGPDRWFMLRTGGA